MWKIVNAYENQRACAISLPHHNRTTRARITTTNATKYWLLQSQFANTIQGIHFMNSMKPFSILSHSQCIPFDSLSQIMLLLFASNSSFVKCIAFSSSTYRFWIAWIEKTKFFYFIWLFILCRIVIMECAKSVTIKVKLKVKGKKHKRYSQRHLTKLIGVFSVVFWKVSIVANFSIRLHLFNVNWTNEQGDQ